MNPQPFKLAIVFGVMLALVGVSLAMAQGPTPSGRRAPSQSGSPTVVSYQGYVTVGGTAYNGTGYFKFAVVNAAGNASYWSNDGTSTSGDAPTNAVSLTVSSGLFNVLLGDTTLTNMTKALTTTVFSATDRYLRVWFSTSASGPFTQLSPDRRFAAVPYALSSETTNALQGNVVSTTVPSVGQVLKWDGSTWFPATITGTTYTAGFGLALNSGQFNVVTSTVQQRVSGSCASGSAVQVVNQDGTVTCGGFWSTTGNSGTNSATNFIGTTDNVSFTIRVNNAEAFQFAPNATSPNLIGGYNGNWVTPTVYGAVIAGGGQNTALNRVTDHFGVIGGGNNNQAGDDDGNVGNATFATVGGGAINTASGGFAIIGGGRNNTATGGYSTVAGGRGNTASGSYSTVTGGYSNDANGDYNAISGGFGNTANGHWTFIGGGSGNVVTSSVSYVGGSIVGGQNNQALGDFSFIGAGYNNTINSGGLYNGIAVGNSNVITSTGWYNFIGGGRGNSVLSNNYSFIGSGYGNTTNGAANAIGGGQSNVITAASYSFIGGGNNNVVSGDYAVIPGGNSNSATADYAFAAGRQANALNQGAFVWADSIGTDLNSTANNQFLVRATGGISLSTNSTLTTGCSLAAGSGTWACTSDKNAKANFAQVNRQDILARVDALPITTWNYKSQDTSIRHIGPMAQDFAAAFGVGENTTTIGTVDADGVALAAIQGLSQENQELKSQVASLQSQISNLDARLAALEQNANVRAIPAPFDVNVFAFAALFIGAVVFYRARK